MLIRRRYEFLGVSFGSWHRRRLYRRCNRLDADRPKRRSSTRLAVSMPIIYGLPADQLSNTALAALMGL